MIAPKMQLQRSDDKLWKMYFKQQKDMEQLQQQNNLLQQQIQDYQTEIRNLQEQKAVFEQNYENLYNIYIDKDYALKQLVSGRIETENHRIKELQQQIIEQNARIDELLKEKAATQVRLDKELHDRTVQYQDQIEQYIIKINELRHQMTHIQTEADASRTKLMLEYNTPAKSNINIIDDSQFSSFDIQQLTDLLIKVLSHKNQKEKHGHDCSQFNQVLQQLTRIGSNQLLGMNAEQMIATISKSVKDLDEQLIASMNTIFQKIKLLKQRILTLELQSGRQQTGRDTNNNLTQKYKKQVTYVDHNDNVQNELLDDVNDVISIAKKQIIEQNHILDAVKSDPQYTQIDVLNSTVQHNPKVQFTTHHNQQKSSKEIDLNKCQKHILCSTNNSDNEMYIGNEDSLSADGAKEVVESSLVDTQTLGVKRAMLPISTPTFVVGQSGAQLIQGAEALQLTAKRDRTSSKFDVSKLNSDLTLQQRNSPNNKDFKQIKTGNRQARDKLRDAFGNSINSTKSDMLLDQFGNQLLSDAEEQQHLHDKYGNSLYSDSDQPEQFNYF